jgi:hypothetical protein
MYSGFWWGNLRKKDHLEDPGIERRIILRWIFRSRMWEYGLDQSGSGQGQVPGTCECCNVPSGSIKCREFHEWLKTS